MDMEELADALRSAYQAAPWGDKTLAVQLFAIRHAEELEDVSKGELSQQALGKDFAATITDAVKLARYVQLTKDPFGQAEGGAQIPKDYFTPSGTLAFATLVGTVSGVHGTRLLG